MVEWCAERIALLQRLWSNRELSGRDIAERLDVTPRAVFAKVRKLDLPHRYSERGTGTRHERRRRTAEPVMLTTGPAPLPEALRPILPRPCGCAWPMWPDGDRPRDGARFCGAASESRGTYCTEHRARAYRRRGQPACASEEHASSIAKG